MEDIITEGSIMDEQQSSFGIKKIVDCKIGEDGQQMYKVKWEPTWEPAANLMTCQHLIDEFWSFVNIAKINGKVAQEHRKRMALENSISNVMNIDQNFNRISDDDKAEVQRLIARANATSVGTPKLMSPSNMLMSKNMKQQTHNMQTTNSRQPSLVSPQQQQNFGGFGDKQTLNSPSQKYGTFGNMGNFSTTSAKVKANDTKDIKETKSSAATNASSLKYLENFSNPYVKIIIVCKICSKEASKNPGNWKIHHFTHASNEDKPFKCQICNQGFAQNIHLKRHMKKHEKTQDQGNFKTEFSY